jgi:hypothetical protein
MYNGARRGCQGKKWCSAKEAVFQWSGMAKSEVTRQKGRYHFTKVLFANKARSVLNSYQLKQGNRM